MLKCGITKTEVKQWYRKMTICCGIIIFQRICLELKVSFLLQSDICGTFLVIRFGSFLSNQIWIFEQICSTGSTGKCEWMARRSCHICGPRSNTNTHQGASVVLHFIDTTSRVVLHLFDTTDHALVLALTHKLVLIVLNLFDTTDNAAPHFWV